MTTLRNSRRLILASVILISQVQVAFGQETISGEGFPLSFALGYNVVANEGSTLKQAWTIVNDASLPVQIDPTGFRGLESRWLKNYYQYRVVLDLIVDKPITAVGVVIMPFDVWNKPNRSLGVTRIIDLPPGEKRINAVWRALNENEALSIASSITYIDSVRLQDGTVLTADRAAVLERARQLSAGLELSDIGLEEPQN